MRRNTEETQTATHTKVRSKVSLLGNAGVGVLLAEPGSAPLHQQAAL